MGMTIIAWGTGDASTREFHILQDGERVADLTVSQDDIRDLIDELSEWTDAF